MSSVSYDNAGTGTADTVSFATTTAVTACASGVTTFTDPYSKNTMYAFDTFDRVGTVIDPIGAKSSATYNVNGETTSLTSPNNNATGGAQTTATYDAATNLNLTIEHGADIAGNFNDGADLAGVYG